MNRSCVIIFIITQDNLPGSLRVIIFWEFLENFTLCDSKLHIV